VAEQNEKRPINAWIAVDHGLVTDPGLASYTLALKGDRSLYRAIQENDWILVLNTSGEIVRVGRVLRIGSDLEKTTLYFDRVSAIDPSMSLDTASLTPPTSGSTGRVQWSDFETALSGLGDLSIDDVPLIDDHTYIRELLQLSVIGDLLGPAQGPNETIIDMGVRERYLVGKLAPRQASEGGIEGLEGALVLDNVDDEPGDLEVHTGRHDPGAEFDSTTGKADTEADSDEEIDAASNQSLVPSSFGLTFCVDGDIEAIEVEARWGRYERLNDHDHFRIKKNKDTGEEEQAKVRVWQRVPCGGKLNLILEDGVVSHQAPDLDNPKVRVQGAIRPKSANGDRLVTLFLVNAQEEPEINKDTAWVFQPELIVQAIENAEDPAIFRRRPLLAGESHDTERESLEMIYRKQVEFAVGHGISVHATTTPDNTEHATEVRTQVMPGHEVSITETPGLDPNDRPAMQKMVNEGYLDMDALSEMEREKLVRVLSILTDDYATWIVEQRARIGAEVVGYDSHALDAMTRCDEIHRRLVEGIQVLANEHDDKALEAFRFANRAMARQRIHSMFALDRRRGGTKKLTDLDAPKNRSWRPFQLAFVLLSIPSMADPLHKDRTNPVEADADLLWFPTGGGKTEAYLGVAAFTMAIRRLQGDLGGYDSSRGLAVIMRYTLRLLTLQQFQRATTLLCSMEVLRREAEAEGNASLGTTPFTIGLWVGNKVTPGTTKLSDTAIRNIRNPDRWDAGASSPAQFTSCPWCGSEIQPGRDVEVDKQVLRTTIYCGDRRSRCEFSKGKSSKLPHPGLPAVVVDEEIYHRPPSMMIATVDKFALMAWRGEARTLFGRATQECPRHGLLWPEADCTGNHQKKASLPKTETKTMKPIRPPDLIIQDEFHLISGPLGTMVGLYETAVDKLATWVIDDAKIRPKIVASTATVRKAQEQVNNVFTRRVCIFPQYGLDVEDNFFSVQRPIEEKPGRRYLGICSPGSSRPAMLIRIYSALLTASQELFNHFGKIADPYMTAVGYFNSLRELGGMRRLTEDDVQTRAYRVQMSMVERPGLAQRSVSTISELTSRVSSLEIPKSLDQLEVEFKAEFDPAEGKYVTRWDAGENRAVDIVLATNMLSVGVDVNRLGLMVVNGQPKGTAEYIQATSRVGRVFPGLVCSVLTWARPRDLSHYETFEHYHATFYKHVEAQSVTPFSPRAMDRGLTGTLLSVMRLEHDDFNPNSGAGALDRTDRNDVTDAINILANRAWEVADDISAKNLAVKELKERVDEWSKEASIGGRILAYEKKGPKRDKTVALLKRPGTHTWDDFTVPMSMREVEPDVRLIMGKSQSIQSMPQWSVRPREVKNGRRESPSSTRKKAAQPAMPKLTGLTDLVGKNLRGQTIKVAIEGGSTQEFRFFSSGEDLPENSSLVLVLHSGISQPDIGVAGISYGRWSVTQLQDAETGTSQVNLRVARSKATRSLKLPEADWRSVIQIGVPVES